MIAGKDVQVIVGKFAPLLPDHVFDLFPVPCDLIPVHDYTCICSWMYGGRVAGGVDHTAALSEDSSGGLENYLLVH